MKYSADYWEYRNDLRREDQPFVPQIYWERSHNRVVFVVDNGVVYFADTLGE